MRCSHKMKYYITINNNNEEVVTVCPDVERFLKTDVVTGFSEKPKSLYNKQNMSPSLRTRTPWEWTVTEVFTYC